MSTLMLYIHSKESFSTIKKKFKSEKILIIPHYNTFTSIVDSIKDCAFLKIMRLLTAQAIKRNFCPMKTIEFRDNGLNQSKRRYTSKKLIQMDRKMTALRSYNLLLLKK